MNLHEIVIRSRAWIAGLLGLPQIIPDRDDHLYRDLGQFGVSAIEPDTPSGLDIEPALIRTATPPRPRRERATGKHATSFIYFDDILDQIPACRDLMRAMRSVDVDAYDYFSEVGAKVLPSVVDKYVRWDTFAANFPSRGMLYWAGIGPDSFDGIACHYTKIEKNQPHIYVPPQGAAAVYRVTCAYYDKKFGKMPWAYCYAVAVDKDGKGSVIRERTQTYQKLPSYDRIGRVGFTRTEWKIPSHLEWHFRDWRSRWPKSHPEITNASHFGLSNFHTIASIHADTAQEFQVRSTRDGVTVGFSVALGRTPYFFKDRQTEIASDGKRKRIFHAVEEHQRVYRSGKVATIPAHYRGERHFTWKGERISVAPPEQAETVVDVSAWEEEGFDVMPDKAMVDSKGLAELQTRFFEMDRRKA